MPRTTDQLRADALAIWQAGVDAVRADRLVASALRVEGNQLWVGDESVDLDEVGRLVVVGGGKAGAAMAAAVELAIGPRWARAKHLQGVVNVPQDCLRPLNYLRLNSGRPAGANEPRPEGVAGAEQMLRLVAGLGPRDVCLCLLSGGGSALLPAPVAGITLAEKLLVTRQLSAAGANIGQLNAVRAQLSRLKGGGLARACRAGRLLALIISDVAGDPLETIASGPTVPNRGTPGEALAILRQFFPSAAAEVPGVVAHLERARPSAAEPVCQVTNLIIGNNAVAVDAAGCEAMRRGYSHAMVSARTLEGEANQVGRHLAEVALGMLRQAGPDALISGGEPTVTLAPAALRGRGGRNQQLVLAALVSLAEQAARGIVLLSGGSDGEDGPTDAAGALITAETLPAAQRLGLDPKDFLSRNDAYTFFDRVGGLIRTGPTQTNVGDLRVVLVERT